MATSDVVVSAHLAGNAEVFPHVLALHVPTGATVADITYGKGVFWQKVEPGRYVLKATDLQTGVDCRTLPYPDHSVDCVVLDPPYLEGLFRKSKGQLAGSGTHGAFREHYSNGEATGDGPKWHDAVLDLYYRAGREAHRVLEPVQEESPACSGCMSRNYTTDLTDAQWEIIRPLVPPDRSGGRPRQVDIRRVVGAILYINRTGCQWRMLPHDLPNWRLVYYYFSTWREAKRWQKVHDALLAPARRKAGREHDAASAGSVDRSTAEAPEGEERGFDGGKRVVGRERHKVVDTAGLPLALVVTGATVGDARAVPALFRQLPPDRHPRLQLLWADGKYHNHHLSTWLRHVYRGDVTIDVTRRADAERGFKPVRRRWVLERTNGWVKRCRRNALDYETTTSSSEAMVRLTMIKLMLNRLTDEQPGFPFRYPKKTA